MKRILLISLLLLAVIFTVSADRRRMLMTRNVASAAYDPSTDATVVQWFKTETITGTNGIRFNQWPASIGNNAYATSGREPLFQSGAFNGRDVVYFDNSATDRYMTNATVGTLTQPYEIWFVGAATNNTFGAYFVDGTSASGTALCYNNGTLWAMYAGATLTGSASDGNYHIFRFVCNGASSSITVDGGAATTGNAGSGSMIGATLGNTYNFTGGGRAKVGELFIRNAVGGDTTAVRDYLRTRWATY